MRDEKTVFTYVKENLPFITGVAITVFNLYITSLLLPLKADINVLAEKVESIEDDGSVLTRINTTKIDELKYDLADVRDTLRSIDGKVDRLVESTR